MANKTDETEKRDIKVKALVNLKYDEDIVKAGKEFLIRGSELENMTNAGYIELVK